MTTAIPSEGGRRILGVDKNSSLEYLMLDLAWSSEQITQFYIDFPAAAQKYNEDKKYALHEVCAACITPISEAQASWKDDYEIDGDDENGDDNDEDKPTNRRKIQRLSLFLKNVNQYFVKYFN